MFPTKLLQNSVCLIKMGVPLYYKIKLKYFIQGMVFFILCVSNGVNWSASTFS